MKLWRVLLVVLLMGVISAPAFAEGIRWQAYKDGMAQARGGKKKIFVNFYARW